MRRIINLAHKYANLKRNSIFVSINILSSAIIPYPFPKLAKPRTYSRQYNSHQKNYLNQTNVLIE